MKAKTLSLISKGIAVIFLIVMAIISKRPATEIVLIAGVIANTFVAVDASIIVKNVKEKKL